MFIGVNMGVFEGLNREFVVSAAGSRLPVSCRFWLLKRNFNSKEASFCYYSTLGSVLDFQSLDLLPSYTPLLLFLITIMS